MTDTNSISKASQKSGVSFPKWPLSKVIELGKAVYELGDKGENPVPKAEALDQIGRAASGGTSSALVATINAYGVTTISHEKLSLTEKGKILISPEANEEAKRQAAYDLLSRNKFFADLASRYTDRALPPSDKTIHNYLTQTHGFSSNDAETFWSVTQQNLKDYSLIKSLANGTKMFLPRPVISNNSKELLDDNDNELPSDDNIIQTATASQTSVGKVGGGLTPEFHFNIQIHLPENSTPENYDAIFKSIATYLLGRNDLQE